MIKGLTLCLISTILILNVGKVARTFAFVPLYLFGASYYILFALVFLYGLFRIIFRRKIKLKEANIIFSVPLFFLSMFFFLSVYDTPVFDSVGNAINSYHASLNGYYSPIFFNPFNYYGGFKHGLLGLSLGAGINNNTVAIFLGIMLLVVSLLIFFMPLITSWIKNDKKKEKPLKLIQEEEKEEKEVVAIKEEEPTHSLIAPEPVEVKRGFESDQSPFINQNSGFSKPTMSLDDSHMSVHSQSDSREFTPLVFSRQRKVEVMSAPISEPISTKVEIEPIQEETLEEQVEVENLIETRPEVVNEVIEEKPQIDESLVRAQPIFLNEVEKEVAPIEKPLPIIEEPKKKEPINWVPPSTDLLMTYENDDANELNNQVAANRVEAINNILANFRVGAHCTGYKIGPSVTRYNIEYEPNVTMKSVEKLVSDISMRLGGVRTRFTPIVSGESFSGLEAPNAKITTVSFKEVVEALPDAKKHPLSVGFGKNLSGTVIYADFNKFPHILVAGTTGSGKSIFIHSIIASLIMRASPDLLRIVLVDPKMVEMSKYKDMPHLLCPIITEPDKAKVMLTKLVDEMNHRYQIFAENGMVSEIDQYNEWASENGKELMPFIVVVLDEYADLVDRCKDIGLPVVSIAQKARACGIHLLISTQRPSTNIITGVIKGNLPTHVALRTASYTDSMTIIGEGGAEQLLGKGDMLVESPVVSTEEKVRLQGCFVQNKEILRVVAYLKEHYETNYDPNFLDLVDHSKEAGKQLVASGEVQKEADEAEEMKYQSVKDWVLTQKFVSMSKIQRECMVGFNRAGKFFKRLQMEGIVSTEVDGNTKGCAVIGVPSDDNEYIPSSEELIG
jgi:S-DNA-T family DNA segregation ATPase FtsK/SpoIIIE